MEEDMKEEGMQINILMQKYIVCLHILPGKKRKGVCLWSFLLFMGEKRSKQQHGSVAIFSPF